MEKRIVMADTRRNPIPWARWLRRFGTLIGFVIVIAVFWWQKPTTFMTIPNWLNITQQVSILGVVAFTMTVVMVMGDFDLSVGTMASLAGIVAAADFQAELPAWVGVSEGLLVGILGGLLNGFMVSDIGIMPFVATHGTLTIFGGIALYRCGGITSFGQAI